MSVNSNGLLNFIYTKFGCVSLEKWLQKYSIHGISSVTVDLWNKFYNKVFDLD